MSISLFHVNYFQDKRNNTKVIFWFPEMMMDGWMEERGGENIGYFKKEKIQEEK